MNKKILIIDAQIFQTHALDRGMGRYSCNLVRSIIESDSFSRIVIVYSKNLPTVKIDFEYKRLRKNIDTVSLDLIPSNEGREFNDVMQINKHTLNLYIEKNYANTSNISFLLLSAFQEPSGSTFPDRCKKVLLFYDLIPLLYYSRYRHIMNYENYLQRFISIFDADKILSISQSVKNDLVIYLGVDRAKIEVIDGAAIISENKPKKPKLKLPNRYMLMPSSDDPRKNNRQAVIAFENYRSKNDEGLFIVITSNIHSSEKRVLSKISRNIIFTGNLSGNELDWMYINCEAVIFIPESEGLGLPILEAVNYGKKIICSAIPVFEEISNKCFNLCNPNLIETIETAIESALSSRIDESEYSKIKLKYSWTNTASKAISAIESCNLSNVKNKPKIAIFSPRPDGVSAIGKIVAESHPTLANYFDIDYYIEEGLYQNSTRPNYLKYISNYMSANNFNINTYKKYDAVFYHIGNSDYHIHSILNSLYLPGYLILHDTNLTDVWRVMVELGVTSQDRFDLERLLQSKQHPKHSKYIGTIINSQIGVMVHSKFAREAVREVQIVKNQPISIVNLPSNVPTINSRKNNPILNIGMAGIIAGIKGVSIIESISKKFKKHAIFSIFGYNFLTPDEESKLRTNSNINLEKDLSDFDFYRKINSLDIFVNYRMSYQGETSLSTIEAMRNGVVVIVRNIGWYSELPNDAVVKIDKESEVIEVVKKLIENRDIMSQISKKAVEYITKYHTQKNYAEAMLSIMKLNNLTPAQMLSGQIKTKDIKTKTDLLKLKIIKGDVKK